MGRQNLFVDNFCLINTSASDDTIHCIQSEIACTQSEPQNYNKKEIVRIIEKYSMPGNVVTQLGEYMSRPPVRLFHIMLTMDMSQRYKQAIRHHILSKSQLTCYLHRQQSPHWVVIGILIK
jgi:predicted DNA-binding protein (UPF0278 family)